MSEEKISLPDVTEQELHMIIEGLEAGYQKKLRKAQKVSNDAGRSAKIEEQLRVCQTILQECLAIAHHVRTSKETISGTGSILLPRKEESLSPLDLRSTLDP